MGNYNFIPNQNTFTTTRQPLFDATSTLYEIISSPLWFRDTIGGTRDHLI